jgi:predicted MPP superfamily phosphohydrolase
MPAIQAPSRSSARLLTRRNFLVASVAAVGGLSFYSNDVARHELQITQPAFFIDNLPPAFEGFRIAQISDIHLEEYTEDYFLRHVIHQVNALTPDMVLVTGDFVSRGPLSNNASLAAAGRCAEILTSLDCKLRYAVLGNHDAAVGSSIIRAHMEANGLPLLVNQNVRIERGRQHIILAGVDDISYGSPDLDLAVPENPDAPVFLMAHEPDYAITVALHPRGKNVDFILSGHTHGGQIRIPGLRPLALPPLVGNSQLYVNRGIGTVGLPFRLNCPPEITLATLHASAST